MPLIAWQCFYALMFGATVMIIGLGFEEKDPWLIGLSIGLSVFCALAFIIQWPGLGELIRTYDNKLSFYERHSGVEYDTKGSVGSALPAKPERFEI